MKNTITEEPDSFDELYETEIKAILASPCGTLKDAFRKAYQLGQQNPIANED